ncbi:class I SAM-dependent methyltransferase [Candidatus Gracilibacteria bacterium]|nr:class I SAM-dependent methyltransferase [Candidatus Gracilibacteria bacterium]NJS41459.1 class I SAM-dependent methyltransferase [Candidatus Gracilibacteria bacterium]
MSQISNTVIENENKFWSLVFKNEFDNSNNKLYSHYWWQKYYESITKYVTNYCSITESSQILEPGCGSGKASILLGKNIPRTLLDISPEALKYAQIVSKRFKTKQIKFELGDVFNLRKYYSAYDLVWNIGVVEHYSLEQIEKIFIEMVCCTKPGGFVSFGVPNFWTGATLKAYLLTLPIINKIAGYRLDSENFYSEKS